MAGGLLNSFISHHLHACRRVLSICVHGRLALPGRLQTSAGAPMQGSVSYNHTIASVGVGQKFGQTPRRGICNVHLLRFEGGVQSGVLSQPPLEVGHSEHGVSHSTPGSGCRVPAEGMCIEPHAGSLSQLGPSSSATHQPLWRDPQRPQHRQVPSDHRPLLPCQTKRQ